MQFHNRRPASHWGSCSPFCDSRCFGCCGKYRHTSPERSVTQRIHGSVCHGNHLSTSVGDQCFNTLFCLFGFECPDWKWITFNHLNSLSAITVCLDDQCSDRFRFCVRSSSSHFPNAKFGNSPANTAAVATNTDRSSSSRANGFCRPYFCGCTRYVGHEMVGI